MNGTDELISNRLLKAALTEAVIQASQPVVNEGDQLPVTSELVTALTEFVAQAESYCHSTGHKEEGAAMRSARAFRRDMPRWRRLRDRRQDEATCRYWCYFARGCTYYLRGDARHRRCCRTEAVNK